MMHPLAIAPTNYTPLVAFKPSGMLTLRGRSLMLDAVSFYKPLIHWISQLNVSTVRFTVELDYFNTSSSKKILEMLKLINDNDNIQEFIVYWGFETDDEDILLKGQILEDRLKKARFSFKELAGV